MTSKNKEQSKEDILAQLHGNDDSNGDSDEDEDLNLDLNKLKIKNAAAKTGGSSESEKLDISPLTEEKERHKKNLMQDLYD